MKKTILLTIGLATALNLFAGETLQLNLVPERGYCCEKFAAGGRHQN